MLVQSAAQHTRLFFSRRSGRFYHGVHAAAGALGATACTTSSSSNSGRIICTYRRTMNSQKVFDDNLNFNNINRSNINSNNSNNNGIYQRRISTTLFSSTSTTGSTYSNIEKEKVDDNDNDDIDIDIDSPDNYHIACGYIAGLHSHVDDNNDNVTASTSISSTKEEEEQQQQQADFSTFESAWDAIRLVPIELLNEFENELWTTQQKKFVFGTKIVSVIDTVIKNNNNYNNSNSNNSISKSESNQNVDYDNNNDNNNNNHVYRYLILNERPHLIQTAVEISHIGAPFVPIYNDDHDHDHEYNNSNSNTINDKSRHHRPSPISQTHLGGLAMALPFWYNNNNNKSKSNSNNNNHVNNNGSNLNHTSAPNCLLIGAGGCSLAHTIVANLSLNNNDYNCNHNNNDKDINQTATNKRRRQRQPLLTAIESCPEVLRASRLWFGGPDPVPDNYYHTSNENNNENNNYNGSDNNGRLFNLVHDTGESYLKSLVIVNNNNNDSMENIADTDTETVDHNHDRLIDVLIIDAEDGTAPPKSMRTMQFWAKTVIPALNMNNNNNNSSRTNDNGDPIGSSGIVVAVNVIGSKKEIDELIETIQNAFAIATTSNDDDDDDNDKYTILVVSPPSEANVSERHKLLFILPISKTGTSTITTLSGSITYNDNIITADDLKGYVDEAPAWEKQIRSATKDQPS